MFYMPHLARWGDDHILAAAEWSELEQALQPLQTITQLTILGPMPGVREQFEREPGPSTYVAREPPLGTIDASALAVPDPAKVGRQLPDGALQLRMRWDGLMMLGLMMAEESPGNQFQVNVNELEPPVQYVDAMRNAARTGPVARV